MADKVYGQYCGLAKALDLVGERWTLLLIRELAFGPRRFSDLVEGLPGISTAVLTERLNRLEEARLTLRRTLPPPAASKVYELTDDGRDLAAAIAPLIAWGAKRMSDRAPTRRQKFHGEKGTPRRDGTPRYAFDGSRQGFEHPRPREERSLGPDRDRRR